MTRSSGNLLERDVELSSPDRVAFPAAWIANLPPETTEYQISKDMVPRGIGDVDADGFDDFAVTISVRVGGYRDESHSRVSIRTQIDSATYVVYGAAERIASGAGGLQSAARFADVRRMSSVGDVNGDGFADFVAQSESTERLYLVAGSAERWQGQVDIADSALIDTGNVSAGDARGLGDLDADGFDDFAIDQYVFYGAPDLRTRALDTRYADASFSDGLEALGDWNGDGYADLLLQATTQRADIVLGGPERFAGRYALPSGGASERVMAATPVGDVDGDGFADITFGHQLPRYPNLEFDKEAIAGYITYGGPVDVEIH